MRDGSATGAQRKHVAIAMAARCDCGTRSAERGAYTSRNVRKARPWVRVDTGVSAATHQRVLADLGQVQQRQLLLREELHRVPLQRLFHDLYHTVDLLHADDRHVLQAVEVAVALRHAARDDDGLVDALRTLHDVDER